MNQITGLSRKMLDHTIPAWAESEAAYFITICCRERGKNTLAFPDIAKIISRRPKLTNNAKSGLSDSCY
jgi:hypothetical protein